MGPSLTRSISGSYINEKCILKRDSETFSLPSPMDRTVPRSKDRPDPPTPLTFQILLALADAPRHGYGIIKEIGVRDGDESEPSTGALYLALQRMEGSGLIEEARSPEGAAADSRPRNYRLTGAGREVAKRESARLATLVAAAREKKLLVEGT